METKDVLLLAAGYLMSVLATFTAPPLSSAFNKFKSGFIERNKSRALASYAIVHELKTGKRDKYLYAINNWGFLSLLILTGGIAGLQGFATGMMFGPAGPVDKLVIVRLYWIGTSLICIMLFLVLRRIFRLLLTLARLENFEDYRAALLRRWPDIELPSPE